MKYLVFSLLFAFVLASCSNEDDNGPTPERFVDDIFAEVEVESGLIYGNGPSLVGSSRTLLMDIYEPEGDDGLDRPAIVLAHGGAFVSGNKNDLRDLCMAYAKKGFVVASISYRLIDDRFLTDTTVYDSAGFNDRFAEAVVLTIGDMKGAIRYLRSKAADYRVDTDKVFAGGVSAGAIMANHIGFLDQTDPDIPDYLQAHIDSNGGLEGNVNDLQFSSEVMGVISFSGSLLRPSWIDSNDPPVFMVHEELDPVVPCDYNFSNLFPWPLYAYGACALQDQLNAAGVGGRFLLYENAAAHVGYLNPTNEGVTEESIQELVDLSSVFMSEVMNASM